MSANYKCIKCGTLLLTLEKGSKYSPKFRAICEGCIPAKPESKSSAFSDLFGEGFKK